MLDKLSIIKDVLKEVTSESFKELSPVQSSIEIIKNTALERLKAQNEIESYTITDNFEKQKGFSEGEKQQIKNESGWSEEIIDAISSLKEYEIYKNAELQEIEVNGRKCLVKNNIDWEQKDTMGRTNKERAEAGLSPITENGETIELHHIGQKTDGALAELTPDEHRGKENFSVLHNPKKESEIDRIAFNGERVDHWKERASQGV